MNSLNEDLRKGDLKLLVDNIFEVDSYVSKMGSDQDVSTISFTVTGQAAAKDLVKFLENGYSFILDADISSGQVKDDKYKAASPEDAVVRTRIASSALLPCTSNL